MRDASSTAVDPRSVPADLVLIPEARCLRRQLQLICQTSSSSIHHSSHISQHLRRRQAIMDQQKMDETIGQFKSDAKRIIKFIDRRVAHVEFLKELEIKSGFPRAYIAAGSIVALLLFILFGVGARVVGLAIGFVYPVYASFKALKTETPEDDKQWLTYWIVYAFLTTFEGITDTFMSWIPFYYMSKILLLLWCILPHTRGAEVLYNRVFEPLMTKYEGRVDGEIIDRLHTSKAAQAMATGFTMATDELKDKIVEG